MYSIIHTRLYFTQFTLTLSRRFHRRDSILNLQASLLLTRIYSYSSMHGSFRDQNPEYTTVFKRNANRVHSSENFHKQMNACKQQSEQ